MLPQPLGPLSRTEESIADAIVRCDWFEKFTKSSFAPETPQSIRFHHLRQRIHFDQIPNPTSDGETISFPDLEFLRPFVCIWPSQPAGRFASKAGTNVFAVSSDFQIYLEADEADALNDDYHIDPDKPNELFRWWLNMIGVLLVGDSQLPAVGLIAQPNIAINRIDSLDLWHTRRASGLGRYFSAIATLRMGTEV